MKSVFIVDDDPTIRNSLEDYLGFRGFDVMAFNNGQLVSRVLEYGTPDLIISDIRMPELNGISLLRRLKKSEKTRNIPVILMSAYEDDAILKDAKKLGADFFLFKPFPLDRLDKLIEKILRTMENKSGKGT